MCVYGFRGCSNFILLDVALQLSQYHLLERLLFLPYIFLPPLLRVNWWVYFWALYSLSVVHIPAFVPIPYCFDYYSFVVLSKV